MTSMKDCIQAGDVAGMKALLEQGVKMTKEDMMDVKNCSKDVAQLFFENYKGHYWREFLVNIALCENDELLGFIRLKDSDFNESIMYEACNIKEFTQEQVEFITTKYPCDKKNYEAYFEIAVMQENLEMAKWFLAKGTEPSREAIHKTRGWMERTEMFKYMCANTKYNEDEFDAILERSSS